MGGVNGQEQMLLLKISVLILIGSAGIKQSYIINKKGQPYLSICGKLSVKNNYNKSEL